MKKLYFLDEEEKNRVLNLHESATKKQYLSEATEKGGAAYVDPATDTPDAKIAREIIDSTLSQLGTDPDRLIKAIEGITTPTQFWKVNELVKNNQYNSGKLDIAGVINDEFGYEHTTASSSDSNTQDLDKIIAKLTTLGITSTIKKDSAGTNYVDDTFKITSKPINTPTQTFTDAATACIKQFSDKIETSSTPGFVYTPLTDGSNLFFGVNYSIQYQTKGKSTIYGNWSCKGNVLNIIRKDGLTWSKAQGGWKNPTDKAVVDPKVAYQQRAKQVNQQTIDATKQIQQSLGVETPSGVLDSAEVETIINKLKQ
jgi:hypothetical protein